jgi:beta-lactam-binding protein with PASTA domain
MIDIIDALNIEKSKDTLDKEEFWYDIKYTEVPNVIGLTLKEAKSQLKKLTINYSGNGNIIKSISPSPGTIVKENSTIKILLSN